MYTTFTGVLASKSQAMVRETDMDLENRALHEDV